MLGVIILLTSAAVLVWCCVLEAYNNGTNKVLGGWTLAGARTSACSLLIGMGMAVQHGLEASKAVRRHDAVYRGVLDQVSYETINGWDYSAFHFKDGLVLRVVRDVKTPIYLGKYQELHVDEAWGGNYVAKVLVPNPEPSE